MAELVDALDLGSSAFGCVGSTPIFRMIIGDYFFLGGSSSGVEHDLAKVDVGGSNPLSRSK